MELLATGIMLSAAILSVGMVLSPARAESSEDVRVSPTDVLKVMSNKDVVIIDVRQPEGWNASDVKIKGAMRENPADVDSWAHKYGPSQKLYLYCS